MRGKKKAYNEHALKNGLKFKLAFGLKFIFKTRYGKTKQNKTLDDTYKCRGQMEAPSMLRSAKITATYFTSPKALGCAVFYSKAWPLISRDRGNRQIGSLAWAMYKRCTGTCRKGSNHPLSPSRHLIVCEREGTLIYLLIVPAPSLLSLPHH